MAPSSVRAGVPRIRSSTWSIWSHTAPSTGSPTRRRSMLASLASWRSQTRWASTSAGGCRGAAGAGEQGRWPGSAHPARHGRDRGSRPAACSARSPCHRGRPRCCCRLHAAHDDGRRGNQPRAPLLRPAAIGRPASASPRPAQARRPASWYSQPHVHSPHLGGVGATRPVARAWTGGNVWVPHDDSPILMRDDVAHRDASHRDLRQAG
jgi:hypothetical protein